MDGWNEDKVYCVLQVLDDINQMEYEVRNCIRGCYTGCYTYKDLGEYIKQLGERLAEAGEETANELEDPVEDDEYEE